MKEYKKKLLKFLVKRKKNNTMEMNEKYLSYICDKFGFQKINEHEYWYNKNENKISIYLNENKQLSN
jgi:hypothetical protein